MSYAPFLGMDVANRNPPGDQLGYGNATLRLSFIEAFRKAVSLRKKYRRIVYGLMKSEPAPDVQQTKQQREERFTKPN